MQIRKPTIFTSADQLPRGVKRIDALGRSLKELFFVENPKISKDSPKVSELVKIFIGKKKESGVWVYYSWIKTAIHIPKEEAYYRLRTARNKNLITEKEQTFYRNAVVGIAGLSVGSAAFATLVVSGGPRRMKIADPDVLDVTNLNRIRATLLDIGKNKAEIAARQAWEIDPFLDLEIWDSGVEGDTIKRFLTSPRLDIFIDEMDSIPMKVQSRLLCKKYKIPVVMATDNGDSIIVDIERFDLEPERPIFHGRVHILPGELINIGRERFIALANEIIDPKYFTARQQKSILDIGKKIDGIPRVGTAAAISGAAVAFVVRQIANGREVPSGRYVMSCEQIFIPKYNSATEKKKRAEQTKKFVNAFKSA